MQIMYVEGDLFQGIKTNNKGEILILPHVCNDRRGFGAGFVVPLAQNYPCVKQAYMQWDKFKHEKAKSMQSGPFEQGQTQFVEVSNFHDADFKLIVANMVAQTLGGNRPLNYRCLVKCMNQVSAYANALKKVSDRKIKIVAPMFGSGLSAGNWEFIENLIEDCWLRAGHAVTIYWLKQFKPNNWNPPENGVHIFCS